MPNKTIYKYVLPIEKFPAVEIHEGAEIISAQMQHGSLCVWAIVDPSAKTELRSFRVIGTGMHFESDTLGKHLGTVQLEDGFLILHVFEAADA